MNFVATGYDRNEAFSQYQQEDAFYILRKKKVLLIEEDWEFSQVLSALISSHLDVDVEMVKNPYQALGRMTHESYDAVILDSQLNGYQALIEAEQFFGQMLDNTSVEIEKVPVIVLVENNEDPLEGLESTYFKIISTVKKDPKIGQTLHSVENELNEILDL